MKTFSDNLIHFYRSLKPPVNLPEGVDILFPQQHKDTRKIIKDFFEKFYSDNKTRRMMFGINPGRFGAGITGINFTAPRQLKENCRIDHPFKISSELSAEFIYEVIEEFGGAPKFYKEWFIGAVSPLGFVKAGKNINYYDDKKLQEAVTPFIIENIQRQIAFGFKTDHCLCIGGEKNFKFLSALNDQYSWFKEIIPLPHPRFILQYRRKQKENYVRQYLSALQAYR
jgi:hypothetical protein